MDCHLPPDIHQLGDFITYLKPRQIIRTTPPDCRAQGGEYVARGKEAISLWKVLAAESGGLDPQNQTYLGELHEQQGDYAGAAHWYEQAANQGYAPAKVNLGQLYEKGLGVEKDMVKALNLYREASGLERSVTFGGVDIRTLMEEIKTLKGRIEDLERQLQQARQTLQEREGKVKQLDNTIGDLEERKKQVHSAAEVAALEAQLRELQADRKGLIEERDRLQQQIAALDERLPAGPTVKIIFPPIEVTSRITQGELPVVKTDASNPNIWGIVTAPAGIRSVKVANREPTLDKNGLFHVEMPLGNTDLPVEVVAVDNQGRKASVKFIFSPKTELEEALLIEAKLDLGSYHALIIGNNDYANFSALDTPINDARRVNEILRTKYGFKTRLLENASAREIFSALNEMREKLTKNDNLLIYYAGHGALVKEEAVALLEGHWLGADADRTDFNTWISNHQVTKQIRLMEAKHVIVVADSCYSGTMTRQSLAQLKKGMTVEEKIRRLKEMAQKKSRMVMTSGDLEPVVDSIGGKHSVFAKHFLKVLEANNSILEGQIIYEQIFESVKNDAAALGKRQTPRYDPIDNAEHESADFIFMPTQSQVATEISLN